MRLNEFDDEVLKISNYDHIYIYGAGDVAREVFFCLSNKPYSIKIDAFLVSEVNDRTADNIEGIPVVSYDDGTIDKTGIIVIAVLEKYRDEICELLDSNEMPNRILMTFESDLWSVTRSRSFEYYCSKNKYPFIFDIESCVDDKRDNIGTVMDCCVYVTRSVKDKPLASKFALREWEKEVYAGAALSGSIIDVIKDDEGDNISEKNRKYCELTVMYWAWKNTCSEYIGLSHYRRRFDFSNEEIKALTDGGIDAIVTTPVINVPSVKYMYGKNHIADDWETMKGVVDNLFPEYSKTVGEIEEANYYVPYNMFIMKRSVFESYCEWLFPILEQCESLIGEKIDIYQNRYIGFMAERLMTVYFKYHKDDLRIGFCNKHFLE